LTGEVFYLDTMPVTVGRDPQCDLFLNNMTVSRRHAVIERRSAQIIVRDNSSLNGTWVDGRIIEEAPLLEGTLLQIGTFTMRFSCA
jgi:pSer/pThr/pTyr-binding forkhead associated (FHA) protein